MAIPIELRQGQSSISARLSPCGRVCHRQATDRERQGMMGVLEVVAKVPAFKQPAETHGMPRQVVIESDPAPHSSCAIALETRNLSRAVVGRRASQQAYPVGAAGRPILRPVA